MIYTEEEQRAIQILLKGSFSVNLNMNDTFAFASADAEEMSVDDFLLMMPVVAKYGGHALTAYVALKRKAEPIHCTCGHDGPGYLAARKEIEEIRTGNVDFMME